MLKTEYKYLKFVRFKKIERWDSKSLCDESKSFRYPAIILGKILSKADITWINIEDNKQYPILGVHAQGEGVYINKIAHGKELTMKRYQKSKVNTLFYCKVRTVKGQWGIVYPQYADSYGSSNMQYLDIDYKQIIPEYFLNLLKLKRLTDIWDKNAIGADGRHFPLKTLLHLEIPLPTVSEQQSLIFAYNNKILKAAKMEQQAEQIEQEIEDYLLTELGIKQNLDTENIDKDGIKKDYKYLKFIKFKDSERWDVSYYSQRKGVMGKYNTVSMNKCIENFMQDEKGCSLRIETSKLPEEDFQYIGMESIEKGSGLLVENKKVKGKEIKSQTVRVPYHYFLYGKLRPYLNKYWYNENHNDNIVCSSEFFVFSIKHDINNYYFKYYLSSAAVQQQIRNAFQGARMPRINERTFNAIQVPLPPLSIQNAIVEHINEQKSQIKKLRQQADELREKAKSDFEKSVFE